MADREFVDFIRANHYGVIASLGEDGEPQAAWVGIAATDDGEVLFDSSPRARKVHNIGRDTRVALVVTHGEVTLQCEGSARVVSGEERDRYLPSYLGAFPDGRKRVKEGSALVCVTPSWARLSDFRPDSFAIRVLFD